MTDNLSPADVTTATEFAEAIRSHNFSAAASILANVVNAGGDQLAADLLQALVDAGADAVTAMAKRRTLSVTQTVGTVPAGATVVGVKVGRIG